ncbi:MAG: hypothetical protein C0601_10615 [Candidatus Muiribacterium halophilum]|uniref:Uncharacterized protein n=1 Tax=Muiribacterium halophilum TaxID=2053465 RepID=A0A2N5ZC77_MUIH1|nr:MAG: hypothetical protein C0601_10615 [Candidatus Muirbacterium halophilum]
MKEIRLRFLYIFIAVFVFSFVLVLFGMSSQKETINPINLPFLLFLKYTILGFFWGSLITLIIRMFPAEKVKVLIQRYAYIFLVIFIVSGMFTFVFNLYSGFFNDHTLKLLSNLEESLSLLTFFLGFFLYVLASFFSVLPKRIFFPASFFLLFTMVSTLLFRILQTNLLTFIHSLGWYIFIRLIFALMQIFLGLYAFKSLRRMDLRKSRLFNPVRFLTLLLFNIIITVTISFTILFFLLYSSVNNLSNGYLTVVMPSFSDVTSFKVFPKVKLVEKIYSKDGKDVHLVGVFDMGREELYGELISGYDSKNTVLLREIITDSSNILNVSDTLQNVFREVGIIKNKDKKKIPVNVVEAKLDVTKLNETTTTTLRNLLALFEPSNFKVFFQKLVGIVKDILKYIKNTAKDFYSLKETGIGQNYKVLQNVLKDEEKWKKCSQDIKRLPDMRNQVLIEKTEKLKDDYKDLVILGGNEKLEAELVNNGYKLTKRNVHPFPFSNYKNYFKERLNITWVLVKEIYQFIKKNTFDEFLNIFKKK